MTPKDAATEITAMEAVEPTTRLAMALRLIAAVENLKNADLAREWKCSQSAVSRMLSGESFPVGPVLFRIMAWLTEK